MIKSIRYVGTYKNLVEEPLGDLECYNGWHCAFPNNGCVMFVFEKCHCNDKIYAACIDPNAWIYR